MVLKPLYKLKEESMISWATKEDITVIGEWIERNKMIDNCRYKFMQQQVRWCSTRKNSKLLRNNNEKKELRGTIREKQEGVGVRGAGVYGCWRRAAVRRARLKESGGWKTWPNPKWRFRLVQMFIFLILYVCTNLRSYTWIILSGPVALFHSFIFGIKIDFL